MVSDQLHFNCVQSCGVKGNYMGLHTKLNGTVYSLAPLPYIV